MYSNNKKPEDHSLSSGEIVELVEVLEPDDVIDLESLILSQADNILEQFGNMTCSLEDQQLLSSLSKSFAFLGVKIMTNQKSLDREDINISFIHKKFPK